MNTDYKSLAHRLAVELRLVLPYAVSRAEDLDEFKRAGNEDPAFPGAEVASEVCASADALLAECEQLGVGLADIPGVSAALAAALRSYATAPGIVEAYGQPRADRAAAILHTYDHVCAEGVDDGGVQRVMATVLREYLQEPDVLERYGRVNFDAGRAALQASCSPPAPQQAEPDDALEDAAGAPAP